MASTQDLDPVTAVFVQIVRSREVLVRPVAELLKSRGLSEPQYNVLRILRGAGEDGLSCQGIGKRMLTRVPDITRLLDRLEDADYVSRRRGDGEDRRVVMANITKNGLDILAGLDGPMDATHREQFAALSTEELEVLGGLLDRLINHNERIGR